ncbi:toxin-antitoxin system YwqK family antitoxin [uncultured Kordia sp.]|uniref:toxin-antitoxin system YwqK family antitoxin n=1 Tax=uncultured Kordia sp. TaxID=507699 RepID=UPI002617ACFF|nr:toxin-antitoxin system YwqK family antitoxin [uncultured Kordia sp.]
MIQKVFFTLAILFVCTNMSIAQSDFYIKLDNKNRVKEIGTLQNGEREGLFFKYKRNGKHKSFIYNNGKRQRIKLSEVNVERKYDSQYKDQILEESYGILKNGKREGLWVTFNDENVFKVASNYKNGALEDVQYQFHTDGEVLRIDKYSKSVKNGICKEFHSGGALHYKTTYKDGKIIDGENIYYYPNGNKKIVNNYKNGLKFGKSTTYYESGAVEIEGIYRDKGLQEGPWKEYYESGALKEEYYYKHGLFHGEYTIYDEKGKILEQYIYKNDKLIKTIIN